MRKALVIGANGFIGSHLTDLLAANGFTVSAFDRFSTDETRFQAKNVTRFAGDFLSESDLEAAVQGQDFVFHFLSTSSPASTENDPLFDIRTNVEGTVQLLDICARNQVKRLYFASTGGAIYGNSALPFLTEDVRCEPISPYGIGKFTVENYLNYFNVKQGLDFVIFRISNPYGPRFGRNKKQGLIPITLSNIAEGRPAVRLGNGEMIRDYIYIEDLMQMILKLVTNEPKYKLYNLGSGIGFSVNQILDTIREVSGIDFQVEDLPKPPTFIEKVVLDTSRFEEEFGLVSFTNLAEGIRKTMGAKT